MASLQPNAFEAARREYKRLRAASATAQLSPTARRKAWRSFNEGPTRFAAFAWELARVRVEFAKLEARKLVRLVQEGDDTCAALEFGDEYAEPNKHAHPEAHKAWERRMRDIESQGVWYYRADVIDPSTGRWEPAEGLGGVIGDLDDESEYNLKVDALSLRKKLIDERNCAMAEEMASRATYAMA